MIDHRLLNRMQIAGRAEYALHGSHGFSMQLRQKKDARVLGAMGGAVGIKGSNADGASAAIALVTPFLGAFEALCLAQPIEQGFGGIGIADPDLLSVQKKSNFPHVRPL